MENIEKVKINKRTNMIHPELATIKNPAKENGENGTNSNTCIVDAMQASSEGSLSTEQNNTNGVYKAKFALNDQSCTMQSNTSKQSRKRRERKPDKVTKKTNSRL